MTAVTPSKFDLDQAPLSVSHVKLIVRDLDKVAEFYKTALGLKLHHRDRSIAILGALHPFLTLEADPAATLANPDAPGLFHTAFLLPSRADLSSWLAHVTRLGIRPFGASDHNVSEAIYLDDPEGNGIEVYADRAIEHWVNRRGELYMPSHRLDLAALPEPAKWTGAPDATRIGHVHLQTTDIAAAETFWTGIGMDLMARYPGGSFFGSGGYHHQIAANIWSSGGAPVQPGPKTGLDAITLAADPTLAPEETTLKSPSGVTITLQTKES